MELIRECLYQISISGNIGIEKSALLTKLKSKYKSLHPNIVIKLWISLLRNPNIITYCQDAKDKNRLELYNSTKHETEDAFLFIAQLFCGNRVYNIYFHDYILIKNFYPILQRLAKHPNENLLSKFLQGNTKYKRKAEMRILNFLQDFGFVKISSDKDRIICLTRNVCELTHPNEIGDSTETSSLNEEMTDDMECIKDEKTSLFTQRLVYLDARIPLLFQIINYVCQMERFGGVQSIDIRDHFGLLGAEWRSLRDYLNNNTVNPFKCVQRFWHNKQTVYYLPSEVLTKRFPAKFWNNCENVMVPGCGLQFNFTNNDDVNNNSAGDLSLPNNSEIVDKSKETCGNAINEMDSMMRASTSEKLIPNKVNGAENSLITPTKKLELSQDLTHETNTNLHAQIESFYHDLQRMKDHLNKVSESNSMLKLNDTFLAYGVKEWSQFANIDHLMYLYHSVKDNQFQSQTVLIDTFLAYKYTITRLKIESFSRDSAFRNLKSNKIRQIDKKSLIMNKRLKTEEYNQSSPPNMGSDTGSPLTAIKDQINFKQLCIDQYARRNVEDMLNILHHQCGVLRKFVIFYTYHNASFYDPKGFDPASLPTRNQLLPLGKAMYYTLWDQPISYTQKLISQKRGLMGTFLTFPINRNYDLLDTKCVTDKDAMKYDTFCMFYVKVLSTNYVPLSEPIGVIFPLPRLQRIKLLHQYLLYLVCCMKQFSESSIKDNKLTKYPTLKPFAFFDVGQEPTVYYDNSHEINRNSGHYNPKYSFEWRRYIPTNFGTENDNLHQREELSNVSHTEYMMPILTTDQIFQYMPLSVYVKAFYINWEIPGIQKFLSHKHLKHIPIGYCDMEMQKLIFNKEKLLLSIRRMARVLSAFNLATILQTSVHKLYLLLYPCTTLKTNTKNLEHIKDWKTYKSTLLMQEDGEHHPENSDNRNDIIITNHKKDNYVYLHYTFFDYKHQNIVPKTLIEDNISPLASLLTNPEQALKNCQMFWLQFRRLSSSHLNKTTPITLSQNKIQHSKMKSIDVITSTFLSNTSTLSNVTIANFDQIDPVNEQIAQKCAVIGTRIPPSKSSVLNCHKFVTHEYCRIASNAPSPNFNNNNDNKDNNNSNIIKNECLNGDLFKSDTGIQTRLDTHHFPHLPFISISPFPQCYLPHGDGLGSAGFDSCFAFLSRDVLWVSKQKNQDTNMDNKSNAIISDGKKGKHPRKQGNKQPKKLTLTNNSFKHRVPPSMLMTQENEGLKKDKNMTAQEMLTNYQAKIRGLQFLREKGLSLSQLLKLIINMSIAIEECFNLHYIVRHDNYQMSIKHNAIIFQYLNALRTGLGLPTYHDFFDIFAVLKRHKGTTKDDEQTSDNSHNKQPLLNSIRSMSMQNGLSVGKSNKEIRKIKTMFNNPITKLLQNNENKDGNTENATLNLEGETMENELKNTSVATLYASTFEGNVSDHIYLRNEQESTCILMFYNTFCKCMSKMRKMYRKSFYGTAYEPIENKESLNFINFCKHYLNSYYNLPAIFNATLQNYEMETYLYTLNLLCERFAMGICPSLEKLNVMQETQTLISQVFKSNEKHINEEQDNLLINLNDSQETSTNTSFIKLCPASVFNILDSSAENVTYVNILLARSMFCSLYLDKTTKSPKTKSLDLMYRHNPKNKLRPIQLKPFANKYEDTFHILYNKCLISQWPLRSDGGRSVFHQIESALSLLFSKHIPTIVFNAKNEHIPKFFKTGQGMQKLLSLDTDVWSTNRIIEPIYDTIKHNSVVKNPENGSHIINNALFPNQNNHLTKLLSPQKPQDILYYLAQYLLQNIMCGDLKKMLSNKCNNIQKCFNIASHSGLISVLQKFTSKMKNTDTQSQPQNSQIYNYSGKSNEEVLRFDRYNIFSLLSNLKLNCFLHGLIEGIDVCNPNSVDIVTFKPNFTPTDTNWQNQENIKTHQVMKEDMSLDLDSYDLDGEYEKNLSGRIIRAIELEGNTRDIPRGSFLKYMDNGFFVPFNITACFQKGEKLAENQMQSSSFYTIFQKQLIPLLGLIDCSKTLDTDITSMLKTQHLDITIDMKIIQIYEIISNAGIYGIHETHLLKKINGNETTGLCIEFLYTNGWIHIYGMQELVYIASDQCSNTSLALNTENMESTNFLISVAANNQQNLCKMLGRKLPKDKNAKSLNSIETFEPNDTKIDGDNDSIINGSFKDLVENDPHMSNKTIDRYQNPLKSVESFRMEILHQNQSNAKKSKISFGVKQFLVKPWMDIETLLPPYVFIDDDKINKDFNPQSKDSTKSLINISGNNNDDDKRQLTLRNVSDCINGHQKCTWLVKNTAQSITNQCDLHALSLYCLYIYENIYHFGHVTFSKLASITNNTISICDLRLILHFLIRVNVVIHIPAQEMYAKLHDVNKGLDEHPLLHLTTHPESNYKSSHLLFNLCVNDAFRIQIKCHHRNINNEINNNPINILQDYLKSTLINIIY